MSSSKRAEDVPSCWLCLEEGPDEVGAPLVRDCSCRGTSGFAHLSCIVKYAETEIEGKRLYQREGALKCMGPFSVCPNCKQQYQDDLYKPLAKACVEFVEGGLDDEKNCSSSSFPHHDNLYANALLAKLCSLDGRDEDDKDESEVIRTKFFSALGSMRSRLHLSTGEFGLHLHLREIWKPMAMQLWAASTIGLWQTRSD
eukprot:scaffold911_cov125-Skeletonema_dohrnii-CCMP3373.AAC.7